MPNRPQAPVKIAQAATKGIATTIAAAQSISVPLDVAANVREHLALVQAAAEHGVQWLVFPELSLTGYELAAMPGLAPVHLQALGPLRIASAVCADTPPQPRRPGRAGGRQRLCGGNPHVRGRLRRRGTASGNRMHGSTAWWCSSPITAGHRAAMCRRGGAGFGIGAANWWWRRLRWEHISLWPRLTLMAKNSMAG